MKIKKILSLIASLTFLSGPVLLLSACDSEVDNDNLPSGKLPNELNNRVLFDFLGIDYTWNVGDQFKQTYSDAGLDLIINDVQGTIARQKFYEFFHDTLNYSADTVNLDGSITMGQANLAFEKIKDDLGLSLLTRAYFNGFTDVPLDKVSTENNNDLLFQTKTWHQSGTSIFNYNNINFYNQTNPKTGIPNNPDEIFSNRNLYHDYGIIGNKKFDQQIATIAKHADQNYSDEISKLLPSNARTWKSDADINKIKPNAGTDIDSYQRNLKRFQWLLRFRYQQYYQYQILPALNKTLFTMSWILNNLFTISNENGVPIIDTLSNNTYIGQLQDINEFKTSNYRTTWDFSTSSDNAFFIDKNWNNVIDETLVPKWKSIIKDGRLNINFFNQLHSVVKTSANFYNIDPNFGINGFNNTINSAATEQVNAAEKADWLTFAGGLHYYKSDSNHGNFTYTAPMYFLNIIQKLDFSYLMMDNNPQGWIPVDDHLIKDWNNSKNKSINTELSNYLKDSKNQEQKWNIFWQMLYSIADSSATGVNSDKIKANFDNAAKNMFPFYIPKNNIYEKRFWEKVKSWY